MLQVRNLYLHKKGGGEKINEDKTFFLILKIITVTTYCVIIVYE